MYMDFILCVMVIYFTVKKSVERMWKYILKMWKSRLFVNIFAENSVENVENVKVLTCI